MKCDIIPQITTSDEQIESSSLFTSLLKEYNRSTAKDVYLKIHTDKFKEWFGGDWTKDKTLKNLNKQGEPIVSDGKLINQKGETLQIVDVKNKTTKDRVYGDTIATIFDKLNIKNKVILNDNLGDKASATSNRGDIHLNPEILGKTSSDNDFRLILTSIIEGTDLLNDIRKETKRVYKKEIEELEGDLTDTQKTDLVFLSNFSNIEDNGLQYQADRLVRGYKNFLKLKDKSQAKEFINLVIISELNTGNDPVNSSSVQSLKDIKDLKNQELVFDFTNSLTNLEDLRKKKNIPANKFYQIKKDTKDYKVLQETFNQISLSPLGLELFNLINEGKIKKDNVKIVSSFPLPHLIAAKLGIPEKNITNVQQAEEDFPIKDDNERKQAIIESMSDAIFVSNDMKTSNSIQYGKIKDIKGGLTEVDYKKLVNTNRLEIKELENRYSKLKRNYNTGLSSEKAKEDLRQTLKDLENRNAREQFLILSKKASEDLDLIVTYLEKDKNFNKITDKTFYKLSSIPKLKEAYSRLNNSVFGEGNKIISEQVLELNRLLNRVDYLYPKRVNDIISLQILDESTDKSLGSQEEVKQILREGVDLKLETATFGILAASGEKEFAILDKLYKRRLTEIRDSHNRTKYKINKELELLEKAGVNIKDFSWMIDKESGNYTQQESGEYTQKVKELNSKLEYVDEEGQTTTKKFKEITTKELQYASKEDIKYNKQLAKDKSERSQFLLPESYDSKKGVLLDGKNRIYSSYFKTERTKHEFYDPNLREWKKKGTVSQSAYEEYLLKFYDAPITYNKAIKVKGEYTGAIEEAKLRPVKAQYIEIKSNWWSKDYKNIYNNKAKLRWYNFFKDTMYQHLKYLPSTVEHSMKGRIPVSSKSSITKLSESPNKMKMITKGFRNSLVPEALLGEEMLDENGRRTRDIPILYVNRLKDQAKIDELELELSSLDPVKDKNEYDRVNRKLQVEQRRIPVEDLNLDLGEALDKFTNMAENYRVLNEFDNTVTVYRESIINKNFTKEDELGLKRGKDGSFKKIKGKDSKTLERLDTWIEDILYNSTEDNDGTVPQFAKQVMFASSVRNMAFNIPSAINNLLMGKFINRMEGFAGQFYNNKDYSKANKVVNSYIMGADFMKERKGGVVKTKLNAAITQWGLLQDQKEVPINSNTKGGLETIANIDHLFILQDAGEYDIQARLAVAMLENAKLELDSGDKVSVWDAHDLIDGEFKLKPQYENRVKFDFNNKADLINKIIGANQYMHGRYTKEDKAALQQKWYGQMAFHYKKWVVPQVEARFRKKYYDERLGEEMEGRYRTAAFFLHKLLVAREGLKNIKEDMTPSQIANMKRNAFEAVMITSTSLLFYVLSSLGEGIDDEKDPLVNKLNNFFIARSSQLSGEFSTFINPVEWYKQLKSPFAALGLVQEVGDLFVETVKFPFVEEDKRYYQRGVFKDELKLKKEFYDISPLRMINVWKRYGEEQKYFIGR